jgi:hypothetical protein
VTREEAALVRMISTRARRILDQMGELRGLIRELEKLEGVEAHERDDSDTRDAERGETHDRDRRGARRVHEAA